jgi:cytochrome P450
MSNTTGAQSQEPIYWDPYRPDISANPYPTFRRLRQEAPLYYNPEIDFYAVSRYSDVEACLLDSKTYSNARGDVLEFVKAGIDVPTGMFIWNDAPVHTVYRSVLTRVFTPKRMGALEGKIRAYCARCLDPKIGADKIDFIADLGQQLPGGVIGMLLGIPEEDQAAVRERVEDGLRTEVGKPMSVDREVLTGSSFEEYVDWRVKHPSEDLMTELLRAEFVDQFGVKRNLTRDEVLVFIGLLAGAGNETTSRLIGWIGKLLSDNPDQRRKIVKDPSLVPAAVEEVLRCEPPAPFIARYVPQDTQLHGTTMPAGSALVCLVGAANRDEDKFPDGEKFDVQRQGTSHLTFSRGIHNCLGSALARVEGRVALEELLKRFPDWTVDIDNAQLSSSSTTRGWDTLPAFTR